MSDSRPAPLSFRPTRRLNEDFYENLFEDAAQRRGADPVAFNDESAEALDDLVEADAERPDAEDGMTSRREGLPADFRMRHDAHYVDQIVSRRPGEPVHLIAIAEIDGRHPVAAVPDLQPLVRSVARFGILQPLLVRRHAGCYQLIAGRRRLAAAVAAGLSEVPCLVYFADEEKARALADAERIHLRRDQEARADAGRTAIPIALADLAEDLGAIVAGLHLAGDRDRSLRGRMTQALIQMEVQRAAWLSQALAVLAGDASPDTRAVDLRAVVERVVAALTPERLLAGVEFQPAFPGGAARIQGDERLCSLAVAGLVTALQPLVERVEGSRVHLALITDPKTGTASVEASQQVLAVPALWQSRFLDPDWVDRPGGHRASVMLAAAGRVAKLHDGALSFAADGDRGCRLVLAFPREC